MARNRSGRGLLPMKARNCEFGDNQGEMNGPPEPPTKAVSRPLTRAEAERHWGRLDLLVEFSRLFAYDEDNDRSIAIVGAAFLDSMLRDILMEFMVDDSKEVERLLQPEGPLGTYGSRVTACYCLGHIGPIVAADLRLVGKIRNRFAHDLRTRFSDPPIAGWCRALRWHREAFMHDPPPGASDRDFFQVGVNQLVTFLNAIPGLARFEKRSCCREG